MSSAQAIYSPKDSDRDNIRVITITNSPTPSDLVHCWLETVSLQDICGEYATHLALISVADKPKRKKISLWGAWHGVEEGSDAVGRYVPSASAYRFYWGDFAALSYVWGSPRDRRDIMLNGEITSVTRNLESALELLRSGECAERIFTFC
jgi:hypothetical protein